MTMGLGSIGKDVAPECDAPKRAGRLRPWDGYPKLPKAAQGCPRRPKAGPVLWAGQRVP